MAGDIIKHFNIQHTRCLGWSTWKPFADVKSNFTQILKSSFDRIEKTMGKGENGFWKTMLGKREKSRTVHFLHFLQRLSTRSKTTRIRRATFILSSANIFSMDKFNNLSFGMECRVCIHQPSFRTFLGFGGFTPYQQYFSYLSATVYKSMFPGLSLTSS